MKFPAIVLGQFYSSQQEPGLSCHRLYMSSSVSSLVRSLGVDNDDDSIVAVPSPSTGPFIDYVEGA